MTSVVDDMRGCSSSLLWLLLPLVLVACSGIPIKPEAPRVTLIGLEPVSVDLFEQRYRVRLRIKNPNALDLPIRGIDFRLDINGQAFADGVGNQRVDVPAYGEAVVELEASSNLFQVFRQLQALQQGKSPQIEYRLSGTVAAGSLGQRLPFDYSGRLSLEPRPPPVPEGL